MFFPPYLNKRDRGFTLIELLVVITIIAVLVGLLFPVGNAVMNSSRKTQASADEARVVSSCVAYQTDYGKLPLVDRQVNNGGVDTVYGDPHGTFSSAHLCNILRAIPEQDSDFNQGNKYNPRQVVYLQSNNAKNPNDPRAGFLVQDHNDGSYNILAGALVDPWGSEYVIWLDANSDGDMNQAIRWFYTNYPKGDQPFPVGPGPGGPVQVGSMGPDGNFGVSGAVKGSDDVVTW